jgi:hypothetical protein
MADKIELGAAPQPDECLSSYEAAALASKLLRETISFDDDLAYRCRIRKPPTLLTSIFMEITRNFYQSQDNLHDNIKTWNGPGAPDGVFIEPMWLWDENVNKRPAVFVGVPGLKYSSEIEGVFRNSGYDVVEGEDHHARLVSGSVQWNHVAKSALESMRYSECTYDLVDAFSQVIKEDLCLVNFDLKAILEPKQGLDKERNDIIEKELEAYKTTLSWWVFAAAGAAAAGFRRPRARRAAR